jgi:hypothetical protein
MLGVFHRDGRTDKTPPAVPLGVSVRFIAALLQVNALGDPAKVKDEILTAVLESSSHQLEESARNIEEIRSILHWVKTARERTTITIILYDQEKVAKALGRLIYDLSGICNMPA